MRLCDGEFHGMLCPSLYDDDWSECDKKRHEKRETAMTDTNDGPGKIIFAGTIGPTMGAVTDKGLFFILSREAEEAPFKWEQIPSPTADDVTIK